MAHSPKPAPVQEAFPPIALTVREAAQSLGLSESKMYELVSSGEVYSRRVGTRILIPRRALEAFLQGRPYVPGAPE
jgi:excisionase family DNA binding protein